MYRLFSVVIIVMMSSPAAAEIHTWTDAAGVRHYSNVETRGRAIPEAAFDPAAHRRRLACEARQRAMEARLEELATERAALVRAMQPQPLQPPPVTVIHNTVVVRPVVSYPRRAYDRYRAGLERPVWRRPCRRPRPRPRPEKHIPYYKRHLAVPKIR